MNEDIEKFKVNAIKEEIEKAQKELGICGLKLEKLKKREKFFHIGYSILIFFIFGHIFFLKRDFVFEFRIESYAVILFIWFLVQSKVVVTFDILASFFLKLAKSQG